MGKNYLPCQEYYVGSHLQMGDKDLASACGLTTRQIKAIRKRAEAVAKDDLAVPGVDAVDPAGEAPDFSAFAMMDRSKGVVSMNGGVSMQLDQGFDGAITDVHIQRAVEAGNYHLAAKLKDLKAAQQKNAREASFAANIDRWHRIRPE